MKKSRERLGDFQEPWNDREKEVDSLTKHSLKSEGEMNDWGRMQEKEQHNPHVIQEFCKGCGALRNVSYYLFLNGMYVDGYFCIECREDYERWREK